MPSRRAWPLLVGASILSFCLLLATLHRYSPAAAGAGSDDSANGAQGGVVLSRAKALQACDVAKLRYIGKDTVVGCEALEPPQPSLVEAASAMRWVAAFGDSLTRSPFVKFVDLVAGRAWERELRAFSKKTYHNDHTFCCRDLRDRRTCQFQRKGLEYNTSSVELVQDYLRNDSSSFCYSWLWSPFPDEHLVERATNALESDVPPDVLILNPGLHSLMDLQSLPTIRRHTSSLLSALLSSTRSQPSPPRNHTRILIHEVAHLREEDLAAKKRRTGMTNHNVRLVNDFVGGWVASHAEPEEMSVVPVYRLAEAGDVKPQGDGIHYQGHFQQLLLHLDFYLGGRDSGE